MPKKSNGSAIKPAKNTSVRTQHELHVSLSEMINRCRFRDEKFIIIRYRKPVAMLVPYREEKPEPKPAA